MKRLFVYVLGVLLLCAGLSFAFQAPAFELFIGTGPGTYKGDVRFDGDKNEALYILRTEYDVDVQNVSMDNKIETFSIITLEAGRNWGLYFEGKTLGFETKDIKASLGEAYGFIRVDKPILRITAMSYGVHKKILDSKYVDGFLGVGYKMGQILISQENEFFVTGDGAKLDMVSARLKFLIKPTERFLIGATGSYGYGTNAGTNYGGDLNISYGKTIFGKLGVSYEHFDMERGSTILKGNMMMYYAGIGIRIW